MAIGFSTSQSMQAAENQVCNTRQALFSSPFRPFDECRGNLVADDHDAQDPVVAQQGDGAEALPCWDNGRTRPEEPSTTRVASC